MLVAANLCLDALVGVLLRRELLERGGAANQDTVTPTVFHVAQMESQQVVSFTTAFVAFATTSEQHGAANREVVQGWIDEWLPQARETAQALEPLFAAQPNGEEFAEALVRVEGEQRAQLEGLGLRAGAEVTAA